jgi:hypothetical protein
VAGQWLIYVFVVLVKKSNDNTDRAFVGVIEVIQNHLKTWTRGGQWALSPSENWHRARLGESGPTCVGL